MNLQEYRIALCVYYEFLGNKIGDEQFEIWLKNKIDKIEELWANGNKISIG